MDGWKSGQMDGWMDRWADEQMGGWTDGWMDGRKEEMFNTMNAEIIPSAHKSIMI